MSFQDKVILITGATSGIGEATAVAFGRQAAKVVVSGRRQDKGEEVAKQVSAAGGEGLFVQADVSQEEDVKRLIEATVEKFGRIDVAFNNAGVETGAPLTDFDANEYKKVFDTNVLSIFLSLKYELPVMVKQGSGVVINTSSIFGHVAFPGAGVYIASKFAVEGITKTAALEMADKNVRVCAVAPGAIETDMIDRFAGEQGSKDREMLASLHPVGRLGKPDEIAHAVLYLASDSASFTTGISLPVDGGFLAK